MEEKPDLLAQMESENKKLHNALARALDLLDKYIEDSIDLGLSTSRSDEYKEISKIWWNTVWKD